MRPTTGSSAALEPRRGQRSNSSSPARSPSVGSRSRRSCPGSTTGRTGSVAGSAPDRREPTPKTRGQLGRLKWIKPAQRDADDRGSLAVLAAVGTAAVAALVATPLGVAAALGRWFDSADPLVANVVLF